MGCGCGARAVKLLQAMGYKRMTRNSLGGDLVPYEGGELLVKGDYEIPVAQAEAHHAKVSLVAAAREAMGFVKQLGGPKND